MEFECDFCGEVSSRPPSKIGRRAHDFCSRRCSDLFRRNRVKVECDYCGRGFMRKRSQAERGEYNFCDKSCMGKWQAENRMGPDNPFYRGGTRGKHAGKRYIVWREKVFERDDYTCQDCKNRGGGLQAHHIDGWAVSPERRYLLENGVTLCTECHANRHEERGEEHVARLIRKA